MKLRTPFPDVEETDPEALGVVLVDNFEQADHYASQAQQARGLLPSNTENRRARRAGVATWVPPVEPAQGFEVKDISPERMAELHVGKVVNAEDGTRAEVVWLDPEQGRARYQFVTERMPTRRELLLQRKRRARGTLDVETRRIARARLRKDA